MKPETSEMRVHLSFHATRTINLGPEHGSVVVTVEENGDVYFRPEGTADFGVRTLRIPEPALPIVASAAKEALDLLGRHRAAHDAALLSANQEKAA